MEDLHVATKNDDDEAEYDQSYGFLQFDDEASSGFVLRSIDLKPHVSKDLVALAMSEECLLLATRRNKIIRKLLNPEQEYEALSIPCREKDEVSKLFTDLCGYHCIICMSHGDHYYLNMARTEVVPLPRLAGIDISSVAFSSSPEVGCSGDILLGCKDGSIMLYAVEIAGKDETIESPPKKLFQLPMSSPVYGIVYETYECTAKDQKKPKMTTLVMAVTNDTCYQFTNSASFDRFFDKYNSAVELNKYKKNVPRGKIDESELKLYYEYRGKGIFELHSFAWKTGVGVFYGRFRSKMETALHVTVNDMVCEPYKKKGMSNQEVEIPEAIAVTEYNLFYLYVDNVTVVSKITKEIEHSENFRHDEVMRQMVYDSSAKSLWISSIKGAHRLMVTGDNRDLWKQQLENGNYHDAMELCREIHSKYLGYVAGLYADSMFKDSKYNDAAMLYAESSRSFEEVLLRYLGIGETEGLARIIIPLRLIGGRSLPAKDAGEHEGPPGEEDAAHTAVLVADRAASAQHKEAGDGGGGRGAAVGLRSPAATEEGGGGTV